MNVLLIEDPYVAIDVNQLDDELDYILEEILDTLFFGIII